MEAIQVQGEELSRRRVELGLTQREMAERLGVTRRTVQRWEAGVIQIPAIAEAALRAIKGSRRQRDPRYAPRTRRPAGL